MLITKVKDMLKDYIGKEVKIKYNLGRNKFEENKVIITKLYDYIFLVDDNGITKSFSYSDVITKTIKIYFN